MFGRTWEPIEGRVVTSTVYRIYGGGEGRRTETRWKYVVEYRPPGSAEPVRVELKQAWRFNKQINPSDGAKVPLLIDPGSGKVRFDWKDPRINWKAHLEAAERKRESDFDEALKG